jgi:opacity protein-like surface antigen
MKKHSVFIVALLLLFSGFAARADSVILLKVRVLVANVRSEPDSASPVIARVKFDTQLESTRKIDDFYEIPIIDSQGKVVTGYIHSAVVEVVESKGVETLPKEKVPKPTVPQKSSEEMGLAKMGPGILGGFAKPSDYGGGAAYGANFLFLITKNIGIELSGLRFQSSVQEKKAGEELSKGKLSILPIQLSIQARYPLNKQIIPYAIAGAGYYLISFDIDNELKKSWEALGFDINEKVDNAFGLHFGAGVDYLFSRHFALDASFKYCLAKSKGNWKLKDLGSNTEVSGNLKEIKSNSILLGVGVRYLF